MPDELSSSEVVAPAPPSIAAPATEDIEQPARALHRVLASLQHRDFLILWLGSFLSNVGTWMQNVAQGWLVLQLTNSAFWLGMCSFAAAAPLLVFTILGGVIADRMEKRRLLIATQIAMMLSAFLLAGLTYRQLVTVPHIIVIAFATGVAASLAAPAYQALIPQLVPRAELVNAVGLNSAQFNMSRVIGPTIGGFGIAWLGMAGNFFLNGMSFVAVIIALALLRCCDPPPALEGSFWRKLREGFSTVRRDQRMRVLVELVCVGALLGIPYFSFIPFFARDILHVGERGLGLLMAFSGLGAFFAAITIAYVHKPRRRGKLVMLSGTCFFLAVAGFSLSRLFLLSAAFQFAAGYAIIILVAIINTRLQLLASDALRGRIMSIYATAYLGLPPVGSFAAGLLSRWIIPQQAIGAMAALGLLLFWTILARHPELRTLD